MKMKTHRKLRPLAAALLPLLGALAATSAFAQDSAAAPASKDTKQLQQVVVTGTRSENRTVSESLSPIDVLSPKDLTATGANDIATALNTLLPSLDFPRPAINDGNDALRPATLRGLSPDDVLVLVDGKRYHTSALVNYNSSVGRGSAPADLNSLPISAIDHIEVLRDGAAAQYGSDAIAGVINIVLKHGGAKGSNSISAGGGIYDKGDGAQNNLSGSVGIPLGGPEGKAPGWARLSWNYQSSMQTNRAENSDRSTTIAGAPNPSGIPYERFGDPGVKTYQALVNFGYDLTPNIDIYGYVNGSHRNVTSNGYYRAWNSARNIQAIYPNGFLPQILNKTNDLSAVLGIRGTTAGGWHWDVSADHGQNDLTFDVAHSLNVNEYYALGHTPTYFNAGAFHTKQDVVNVDVSKDVNWGLANPVTLAFGAQYMRDGYKIDAGDPDSYFLDQNYPGAGSAQVFPGLAPDVAGNFSRHSKAAYVDLETDLTDKLSAGVAARYENYSDAGSTRSGKISGRYQFTDTFALRGTVSNGFRAPSLAQQNYQSVVTITDPTTGQLAQTGTYRTSSPAAIALGAKPLQPEKSANYSLGAVWQPLDNFSATLDLYQIRIWNQILYSDTISLTDPVLAAYFNSVVPGQQVTAAQYFANAATTRTRGADLILNYRQDLADWGTLNLTASGNYNKTKILDVAPTPAILTEHASEPVDMFGRASQGLLTKGAPRTKYVFSGDWAIQNWDFRAGLTRYGSVVRVTSDPANDQTFSARWLLDLSASYTVSDWTFTVGADNVTNQYPTKAALSNTGEDRADGLQYSALSPFGFNGRYWYGKVTFRF